MSALAQTKPKFIWPTWAEWKRALRWPYLTVTLLILLTLAGSFVSYERVVTQGHPWLPAQRAHPPCSFCGMTRSFCAMSAGRVRDANSWNHGGPVLYTFGWLWLAGTVMLATQSLKRKLMATSSTPEAQRAQSCTERRF